MPKLSIIVPVYKVERTLNQCVESILRQTFSDWELILIDDGSPDCCGAMCDKWAQYDSRVRVIHKPNGGLSDARNAGIEASDGEFITFVDSDDFISEDTYLSVLGIFQNYKECDIVEYPVNEKYGSREQKLLIFRNTYYESTIHYWYSEEVFRHCYAWNKVYRRDVFNGVRYPKGRLYEDILTLPLLLKNAKGVATCSCGCYYYRLTPDGITGTINADILTELFNAQLEAVQLMSADLMSSETQRQYLTLMNIQLDVYRYTYNPTASLIRLPSRRLPLSIATNNKELIKIILLNCMGIKNMCRLYHAFVGKR